MPPKKKSTTGKTSAKKAAPKAPSAIVITLTLPYASTPERTGTMMITRGSLGMMRQFTYRNPVDLAEVIRTGVLGLNKIEMQPPAKLAPKSESSAAPAPELTPPAIVEVEAPPAQPAAPTGEVSPAPVEAAQVSPPPVENPAPTPVLVPTPTTPTLPTPAAPAASSEPVTVVPAEPQVEAPAALPATPPLVEAPPTPAIRPQPACEAPLAPQQTVMSTPPAVAALAPAPEAKPQAEPDFKDEDDFAEDEADEEETEIVSDIDAADPFWATADYYADLADQREAPLSTQPALKNGAAQPSLFQA